MNYASTERVSALIDGLTARDLEHIYWHGARLRLDTGDSELRVVFGQQSMRAEPSSGDWVSTEIGPHHDDEHPENEDGTLVMEWPPLVPLMRQLLLAVAEDIAADLQVAVEQANERASQFTNDC